jgi:hypothetical protein
MRLHTCTLILRRFACQTLDYLCSSKIAENGQNALNSDPSPMICMKSPLNQLSHLFPVYGFLLFSLMTGSTSLLFAM